MATKKARTTTKKTTKKASPVRKIVKRAPQKVSTDTPREEVQLKQVSPRTERATPAFRFKKSYAVLILAGVLLVALLYALRSLFVAATVNGQPISRLTVVSELEKQSGKQALESMITKELIQQEAKKKNVTVSDQEIDAEIKKIEDNLKQQGQNLDQVLSLQNLSRESLRDQVRVQKSVEKILGNQIQVTEKDVDDYIASNSAQLPPDADQKQLRATISQDLRQQKLSERFQTWLSELRKNAKVDYLVTY